MSLNKLTIEQAHQGLVKKEFSSIQLTEAVFEQIEKENKDINAFLNLTKETALREAHTVDRQIADGKDVGPLAGIPVAVKDNILVQNVKCTAASKILENYLAPYDATVVRRLKKAGAVIIGKTNLDEFAMGSSTENSAYGPTKNPNDLTKVPGGSSGGSAAAVKADQCIYALGSDTGGSIRQPAAFCGVVGLKPTYGQVSRYGLMAMASSLDQIGPLTKTSADAETVMRVISGADRRDATSMDQEVLNKIDLSSLKIGLPKEYFVEGLDEQNKEKVQTAINWFEKQGAQIKEVSLPHSEYALAAYYIIMPAEVSSNLARYDGIKYGLAERGQDLLEGYLKTRQAGFGPEVKRRVMLGTYTLSAGYYDAYYLKAQKVRTLIRQDFINVLEEVDLLMGPVTPTPAFGLGEKASDPLQMYLSDIYTISLNLAGLPAVSVPCGQAGDLPVGLQIIGKSFDDYKILAAAHLYEQGQK